jgi:hypothetical protein
MMPHMITIDSTGDVWVVDCGLHQVLKFKPDALDTPVRSYVLHGISANMHERADGRRGRRRS